MPPLTFNRPQGVSSGLTWIDLLSERATQQPSRIAFQIWNDGTVSSAPLTYGELDCRSRAIAARMQRLNLKGERVLLLCPPGLDYIVAFCACLYAGAIAVPIYPPRPNQSLERFQGISDDAQSALILLASAQQFKPETLAGLPTFSLDAVKSEEAADWQPPGISPEEIAFLQYTSGSTSAPKGVQISHGNLIHNVAAISHKFGLSNQSEGVCWLPPYHDMGLIGGILTSLYQGATTTLMSPVDFLQRPVRWLQAISHTQATISGGPNFAYERCVEKIKPEQCAGLDLSRWSVAFTGAEPIRMATLERFANRFAEYGFRSEAFYPCYGMAESTLMITGGDHTRAPKQLTVDEENLAAHRIQSADQGRVLVGCGQVIESGELEIINPQTCRRCQPNEVGEIWVTSPSIAQGYWQQPEKTQTAFHAYLIDTQTGPFFRTGDLGFLLENELFITGRLKDLIIIRGRNHYPQDLELTTEKAHPALRPAYGAAFAIDAQSEERLVLVHEVERHHLRKLNVPEITQAVRQAIAEHHDLQVYAIVLLKTGSIPKTSSGKIQRYACKQGFQDHTLDVVGDWLENPIHKTELIKLETDLNELKQQVETQGHKPTVGTTQACQKELLKPTNHQAATSAVSATTISSWLIEQLSHRLRVSPAEINIHDPFSSYGLDSATAVSLSGELEEWLERRLSPTLIYDYPSIDKLSQYLATATSPSMVKTASGHSFTQEPIAVVGMECRLPGAHNLAEFWQLLQTGQDAIGEVPHDRWKNPYQESVTSSAAPFMGGFLETVDEFDAAFFGITPREATKMDPQQRWLLEVAWAALEHAGQPPTALAGSLTGVFVGTSSSDYGRLLSQGIADVDAYVGTGNAPSIAANRLSYCLHLQGPSLAVDTACSSSLVAVHLACQSLRLGECNLALAGGVNALLTSDLSIAFSEARMLAADGRCKTFDATADGYGRSEGCGLVVLKRLTDAEQAGDRLAVYFEASQGLYSYLEGRLMSPLPVAA